MLFVQRGTRDAERDPRDLWPVYFWF